MERLIREVQDSQSTDLAKQLLRQAIRRGTIGLAFDVALCCLLAVAGRKFIKTFAKHGRWAPMLSPLWKGRRVLCVVGTYDYQGSMDVLSFEPSSGRFFLHGWSWGSCSICDPWESAFYETDYYEDDSEPFTEDDARKQVEDSSTSYTASELVRYGRMGDSLECQAIRHLFDGAPPPEDEEFGRCVKFYVKPDKLGFPKPPSAEEYRILVHNTENACGFSFGDLLN
ncbi:MAG: hypothetical protein GF334_10215 [Candidatus Altiarchaeales archaeon]|nr:hypothetical protein [Candidatus Altiarchaeales archaeon]